MKSLEALTLLAALIAPGSAIGVEKSQNELVRVTINEERCQGRFCATYGLFDENVEICFSEEPTGLSRVYKGKWVAQFTSYRVALQVAGELVNDDISITNKKYLISIYTTDSERVVGELYSAAPLKDLSLIGKRIQTGEGYSSSLRVQVSSRRKGGGGGDPFPGCTGCTSW